MIGISHFHMLAQLVKYECEWGSNWWIDVSSIHSEDIFESEEQERREYYLELGEIIQVNPLAIYKQEDLDISTNETVSTLYIDYNRLEIREG